MPAETLYRMDDQTFFHLGTWCERYYRLDEAVAKRDAIVAMLESMPVEDAEYSMNHGWPHVANLL